MDVFECFSIDGEDQCERNGVRARFFVSSKTGENEAIQKRISHVSFEEALAHFSYKTLLKKGKIIHPLELFFFLILAFSLQFTFICPLELTEKKQELTLAFFSWRM